jgi:hypothetical protein
MSRVPRALRAALRAALCVLLSTPGLRAEPLPDANATDVAAARALFFDALHEEESHQYADALRDFQRVRAVRDTPAVEYRIAACEEALGRPAAAFIAFEAAISLAGNDSRSADVVQASRQELDALAARVARLTLTVADDGGDRTQRKAQLRLDGQIVAPGSVGLPLIVDPGHHLVTATIDGSPSARAELVVPAGASLSWSLPVSPNEPAPVSPSGVATPDLHGSPAHRSTWHWRGAWIGWATGAALLAGAGVLWWLRSDDIASLDRTCPQGLCPAGADRSSLEATRSRALAEGPWAAVLGGTGLAAATLAVALAYTANDAPPTKTGAELLPSVSPTGAGLLVQGSFR